MSAYRAIAPVGTYIDTRCAQDKLIDNPDYFAFAVNSGTAALALALLLIKHDKGVSSGEVIIPGYACPDLISASLYAGLTARVVDISASDPSISVDTVKQEVSDETIAVIAVNFLGIRHPLGALMEYLATQNIELIEDNAQWCPFINGKLALLTPYAIASFGRGKPVNLAGGGILWVRKSLGLSEAMIANFIEKTKPSNKNSLTTTLKLKLFNTVTSPYIFYWVKKIPGLGLGQTVYHPLQGITELDACRQALMSSNIKRYLRAGSQLQQYYSDELTSFMSIDELPAVTLKTRTDRLLRYPVLLKDAEKKSVVNDVVRETSLGMSLFYEKSLDAIASVPAENVHFSSLPNARQFASQLLTLPLHQYVRKKDAANIISILKNLLT